MTTNEKVARRKLSQLELAADLGNVEQHPTFARLKQGVRHQLPSYLYIKVSESNKLKA